MDHNIVIRSFASADTYDLNAIRIDARVTCSILSMPTETTEETLQYFVDDVNNIYTLVAESKTSNSSCVIGYFRISVSKNPRNWHRGVISIAVSPDYQQCGVGKTLFEHGIKFAKEWLTLHKLELSVLEENKPAIGLYKSFGFVSEGIFKDDTLVSGIYKDVEKMGLILGG